MSSQASTPSSSSSIMEEISTRIISNMVKNFNTEELIDYLGRKNLKLDKNDIKILHKKKIASSDFLELTEEKFCSISFALGPATRLTKFIEIFEEINDDDMMLNHCMKNIILKLLNVKTMTDANEVTYCEFISIILHASIAITKKLTSQDIFIVLKKDISGEDATGRVDYLIKSLKDLLCITEEKPHNIKIGYTQNLAQLKSAFQTNKKKRTAN
ncbi:hypothetical protein C1645_814980 [Glomus cerebriforme]|uniref:SAM domain-containing protein n=1 Tax=Glomus cerebriforme TaxID=658196 RepID=A0A397TF66_9GLOM|nr:hypothetical protein C1645_814980 [Glomus cerebriforme]